MCGLLFGKQVNTQDFHVRSPRGGDLGSCHLEEGAGKTRWEPRVSELRRPCRGGTSLQRQHMALLRPPATLVSRSLFFLLYCSL